MPLTGIKIVDLTRILSGPFATMRFADMGASVIKIENPDGGDDTRTWGPPFQNGVSSYFLSINRNKKSLTLNLKAPEGKKILSKLIEWGDVIIENFRPGLLSRLGFSYQEIEKINPKIVYCSISGYGNVGTRNQEASFDLVVQGESGLMDLTGFPEGSPTKVGVSIADVVAGLNAVEGVLLALLKRGRTGKGQWVDVSLLDSMMAMFTYQIQNYQASGKVPKRKGNQHPSIAPYETFDTQEGYLNCAVGNESLFQKFCEAVQKPELITDSRFKTNQLRVENRQALIEILQPLFLTKKAHQWVEVLKKKGVPAGLIHDVPLALKELENLGKNSLLNYHHPVAGKVDYLRHPLGFIHPDGTLQEPPATLPAPALGEHTQEILQQLGYSSGQIHSLKGEGVV